MWAEFRGAVDEAINAMDPDLKVNDTWTEEAPVDDTFDIVDDSDNFVGGEGSLQNL